MKYFKTFQGDVDIREVKSIPKSAKPMDTKTVMYGEATGHHHTYKPQNNETMKVRGEEVPIQKYVQVLAPAILEHQEHEQQEIPAGKYAILQEREWDVLDQQIRSVMD